MTAKHLQEEGDDDILILDKNPEPFGYGILIIIFCFRINLLCIFQVIYEY